MANNPPASKRSRGIQSVEVGGQLLNALAHHGRPLPLKDLAQLAGMAPAKAHPYVVSYVHTGLMAQDAQGHYGLGPLALQLGLISLQQYDPVRLATPVVEQLALSTGHTAALSVWGDRGATIVRVEQPPTLVHVTMRHGTVMSLVGTATGSLFAAYLDAAVVRSALTERAERDAFESAAYQERLRDIRVRCLSRVQGSVVAGTAAMAAPVFAAGSRLAVAITLIGLAPGFDIAWKGSVATPLLEATRQLTRQLGGTAA